MLELLRKEYSLEIEFLNKRKQVFKFRQATLKELIIMAEAVTDEITLKAFLFSFLVKHGKISTTEFKSFSISQINRIMEFIFNTYGKGFFSKKEGKKQKSPTSSLICIILEKTNETVKDLLKLTWEQIQYLIEGITWNLNEQTKKGRDMNRRSFILKQQRAEISDEDALKQAKILEKKANKIRNG